MTQRLRVPWPDPELWAARGDLPVRLLAVSDEPDRALDSDATRRAIEPIDMIVGCGDLEPDYLAFLADGFHVPLHYVRGNHDVGAAWRHEQPAMLPEPLPDGVVQREAGISLVGFSGSARYSDDGMERSALEMWLRVLAAWRGMRAAARKAPLLVVTHAAPRGMNDAPDQAHRGFAAFRMMVERLSPPLWLHGHTALVRRGIDGRCARYGATLLYNCTGASVVELVPPSVEAAFPGAVEPEAA
jgi:hypothetical protein